MLQFNANAKQWNALESLSYWIADSAYIHERFGSDEPELEKVHDTITEIFKELDGLAVPFWVQNTVIAFSANWRDTKQYYFSDMMNKKNIFRA